MQVRLYYESLINRSRLRLIGRFVDVVNPICHGGGGHIDLTGLSKCLSLKPKIGYTVFNIYIFMGLKCLCV